MGAYGNIVGFAKAHSVHHNEWIARVETAGHVGVRDVGKEFLVGSLALQSVHSWVLGRKDALHISGSRIPLQDQH